MKKLKKWYNDYLDACEAHDKKVWEYNETHQHMVGTHNWTRKETIQQFGLACAVLGIPIIILWAESIFNWEIVPFSNDGPLGTQMAETCRVPDVYTGPWEDLNFLGKAGPPVPLTNVSGILRLACWYWPASILVIAIIIFIITKNWKRIYHD